ncbi:hypothetical protein TWF696_000171 [Orbilia brochopaga]|uniref:Uncharacterized protein n=1 Tax=Orbilia brochopaga TaxID=3140254 RepID=A0AAV9VCV2_9PEZI
MTRPPGTTWRRVLLVVSLLSLSNVRAYYFGAAYTDSTPEEFSELWEPEWRGYHYVDRCLSSIDFTGGKTRAVGIISGALDPTSNNRPGHRLRGMIFYKSPDCTIDNTDQFIVFMPQRDIRLADGMADFYRGVQVLDLAKIEGVDIDDYNSYKEISSDSPWALLAGVPETEGRGIAMNLNIDGGFKPGPSTLVTVPDAGSIDLLATSLKANDPEPAKGRLRTMLLDIVGEQWNDQEMDRQMERMRSTIPVFNPREPQNQVVNAPETGQGQNFFMNLGQYNLNPMSALRPGPTYPMQVQPQIQGFPRLLPQPQTQSQSQSQSRPQSQFQQQQPQLQPVQQSVGTGQQNPGTVQQMNLGMFNSNPFANFGSELLNSQPQGRVAAPIGTRLNALDDFAQQWPRDSGERQPFNAERPFTVERNTRIIPEDLQRPSRNSESLFGGRSPTVEELREVIPQSPPRNPLSRARQPAEQVEDLSDDSDEDILRELRSLQELPGSPTLRGDRGSDYTGPPQILPGLSDALDIFLENPEVHMQRPRQQMAYRNPILGNRYPIMGPPLPRINTNNQPPLLQDLRLEEGDERRHFPSFVDTNPTMEIETRTPPELELDLYDFSELTPINADLRRRLMDGWARGHPILGNLMTLPISYFDDNWAIIEPTYESLRRNIEEIWAPYYQDRWARDEGGYREAYVGLVEAYDELERRRETIAGEIRTATREANRLDPDSTNGMIAQWNVTQLRSERDNIKNRQELLTWKMEDNDRLRARKKKALEDEYAQRLKDLEARYRIWRTMAEVNIEMEGTQPVRALREPTFGRIQQR